jgi:MFS family permease
MLVKENNLHDVRHNVTVNILDGSFFGLAIGFASFTTILPLFVSTMTDSAVLIGLVPAIHNMGWQLPQLFTAKWISKLPRLKRFVILFSVIERAPFFAFALVAALLPYISPQIGLIMMFTLLIIQGFGGGLTANGWQNLISKVIPPNRLATFFGAQSAAANLFASFSAIIAGLLLEYFPGNIGFILCFSAATLSLVVSWRFLSLTKEQPTPSTNDIGANKSILASTLKILIKDSNFVWFLIARSLSQFGLMAMAFYIVFAVNIHNASESAAGLFTGVLLVTQMIINPVMGVISDRWGKRFVMAFGSVCGTAAPLLAMVSTGINWFFYVFILAGIANTIFWIVGMTLSLDFGSEEERPIYVGIANTFIAPSSIIAPIIGGWLADYSGYSATFIFAAVSSIITALIYIFVIKYPRQGKKTI